MLIISNKFKEIQCLSYDVASGSEITSCIKINKPLVIFGKPYDVHFNVAYIMTNNMTFNARNEISK